MGPEPTWILSNGCSEFVNIYQYNNTGLSSWCAWLFWRKSNLAKAIDVHVTFEPIKYPDTFHDLL